MAIAGSGNKSVSRREFQLRQKARQRELARRMLVESLETRQLMAVGPQLIGVQSNEGSLLHGGSVLHVSPNELVFRFDDQSAIDPETLDGIQITRAGKDGIFERAYLSTDLGTIGQVVLDFAAATPGQSGNGIELRFTKASRTDTSLPHITVDGQRINVEVNTAVGLKTTAQNLLTAFHDNAAASALVLATRLRGSEFTPIADTVPTGQVLSLIGANSARGSTAFNAGTSVQVEFVAVQPGAVGREIKIEVTAVDRGGAGAPLVSVSGTTVRIEMNSNSRFASTIQEIINAVNGSAAASSLVRARLVSGLSATRVGALPINYSPITLQGALDVPVLPAYVGLGDSNREVIFRFAEPLPDDQYRLDILGRGPQALMNVAGEAFNGGVDSGFQFELDLGAKIESVVPQPVFRNADGTLSQRRNEIHVYFNDDDLDVASAQDVDFYQLRYTRATVDSNDDPVYKPSRVDYSPEQDLAILTFNRNLDELVLPGTSTPLPIGALRLRIGSKEQTLAAPVVINATTDPGSTFASARDLTADWNLGSGGPTAIVVNSEINNATPYTLDFPGGIDEPGNRDNRYQSHVFSTDPIDDIGYYAYNFQSNLGTIDNSLQLNAITEQQKQRVREIMSLYSSYLGATFVETDNLGFTVAVGDMRAILGGQASGPGGFSTTTGPLASNLQSAVIVDIQDFNASSENEFGSALFREFMKGIGFAIGLGYGDELPQLTIQSNSAVINPGTDTELVFPGNQDIIHGQYVNRPDNKDIDLYRFTLAESGKLSIETIAERLPDEGVLDSALNLYRKNADGSFTSIAANDDYFSQDSLIKLDLPAGDYVVGVSAKGNESYDPNIEDSGLGGRTKGKYQIRLDFRPPQSSVLVDGTADGDGSSVAIDGDADGQPGGVHDFWFIPTGPSNTIFVDKASTAAISTGSLATPFKTISSAVAAATAGKVIRIIGNGGADKLLQTTTDNLAYEIGFNRFGQALADGALFDVPKDVTVMVDSGAILKLSRARISAGSSTVSVDRSGGSFQVLGIPRIIGPDGSVVSDLNGDPIPGSVYFTSLNDTFGKGVNPDQHPPTAAPGDWGGIDFRNRIDGSDEIRTDLERNGLFLNSVVHADVRFGGGQVVVDGVSQVITPIHMVDSRPTIANNLITRSADAAMAATPNSFKESNFLDPRTQANGFFIADFDRVGPEIHGNRLGNNSVNGLFVKVRTGAGSATESMMVAGRFDDLDIVHVISENLDIEGTPGGVIFDAVTPPTSIVTLATQAGGTLASGTYNYKLVYVDASGNESPSSEATASVTIVDGSANRSIRLSNLPPIASNLAFIARRIYRSDATGGGTYSFVAQINAIATTFVDTGAITGSPLLEASAVIRARLNASLTIDPGIIVKSQGARIEVQLGAQLIAEGTDGSPIIFTSIDDTRYGGGGTFDTANRKGTRSAIPGDWGGIYAGQTSSMSLDYVRVAYAGGVNRIDGDFASFNPIEIHQADARIAHSRFELNADGIAGAANPTNRAGRGTNFAATIFVRGAQPIIVDNQLTSNVGAAINIDVNSLNWEYKVDTGRSSGLLGTVNGPADNQGPLVRGNRMSGNSINGLLIRGQELTAESVWDDTDISHVLLDEVTVSNFNHYGGLRLESSPTESLVVKLLNSNGQIAGLTATGLEIDIDDRIGGSINIIGQPGFPVILTSLADDSVGAGFTPQGLPITDTDGNGGDGSLLPTGPEANNGTLIDDDVAAGIPGQFAFAVGAGGRSGFATADGGGGGISAQGTNQLFTNTDAIFEFFNFVDVDGDGNAINLGLTTITQPPTLIAPDLVVSQGTFAGTGGATVRWRVESRMDNGISKVINTLILESDQALGNLQVINYLDEDILGPSDDFLYLAGTPGQDDFRAFTLDGNERIGFSHGGVYATGNDLVNATYEGWAADQFRELLTAIETGGTQYTTAGNIDTASLPQFNDPQLGNVFGLRDITTAFAWRTNSTSNRAVITSFLELVPRDPGSSASSGDWRGVNFDPASNDRNVGALNENESSQSIAPSANNLPSTAQYLGQIGTTATGGDENVRLGFTIQGTLNKASDLDVYSFAAKGGTEVWLDIDRTRSSLDTVVELIDANGNILALSDNSFEEEANSAVSYISNQLTENSAHPLRKSSLNVFPLDTHGNASDLYSTNPRDAGMRVFLPGLSAETTLYHVRVRSSNVGPGESTSRLIDPSLVAAGRSSGSYALQLRLQEKDETGGSSVSYADIRYATNGIQLSGVPLHSPLVGDQAETTNNNDTLANAQELGNLLTTDLESLSIAGDLSSTTDVDWFAMTIDYQFKTVDLAEYLATIFDIDYADGIGRPDTSIYLFDVNGNLVSSGLNSNILDDRTGPFEQANNTDPSRGSAGASDPYIGAVELPGGRYFLAVTNNGRIPQILDTFANPLAANPLVRLQPTNGQQLIVEDHVGSTGGSTALAPIVTQFLDANSAAVPLTLGDMSLYISRDAGRELTDIFILNPFTGQQTNRVGRIQNDIRDLAFRFNGTLQAYDTSLETLQAGDRDGLIDYLSIDFGTAVTNVIGQSGVQTFHENPAVVGQGLDSNVGMNFEAITIASLGGQEVGLAIGNRTSADTIGYNDNIVYQFATATGLAISAPAQDRAVVNQVDQRIQGAGTNIVERGFIDTNPAPGTGAPSLIATQATDVDANGVTTPIIRDATTIFSLQLTGGGTTIFEFNSGPEFRLAYNEQAGRYMRDGDQFQIDGVTYEFETGGVIVLSAANGAGIADGSTVTIKDSSSPASAIRVFEFDRDGTLTNPSNVPVNYADTTDNAGLIQALVNAINGAGFGATAERLLGTNRITVIGKSTVEPMLATGTGLSIEGAPGLLSAVPGSRAVLYDETMNSSEFVNALRSSLPEIITLGIDGDRVNFSGALTGVFSTLVNRGVAANVTSNGNVTAGRIPINFLAQDTAETIAFRIARAINSANLPGVLATASGPNVTVTNAFFSAVSSPLRPIGAAPGGTITGAAVIGTTLYAVSSNGGLFQVDNPTATAGIPGSAIGSYVATSSDLVGIQFSGLTAGPRNAEGGRYANMLFGTDTAGNIYAFDTAGRLQGVFAGGKSSIATGQSGINGLAFSTLDINLWHVTNTRSADPGHGLPVTPDRSRITNTPGGTSWYFGFEDPTGGNANPAGTYTQVTDPGVRATYNFPGGAQGILETEAFSLAGIAAADQPFLYFNYFLATQNQNSDLTDGNTVMLDSFRTYIVDDNGVSTLLTTNNSDTALLLGNDELDSDISGHPFNQETFDNTNAWRQARVNLSPFAGQANLKLRFEFATAGGLGTGAAGGSGLELRLLNASQLRDGQTLTINGQTLEIEMGITVVVPTGSGLSNGDTLVIDGNTFVFHDGTGVPPASGIVVPFSTNQSSAQIGQALVTAIQSAMLTKPTRTGFAFSNDPLQSNDTTARSVDSGINGDSEIVNGTGVIGDNPTLGVNADRDVDMVRMSLDIGATVIASTTTVGSTLDTLLRVFDENGVELARNNNFGGSSDSRVTFVAPRTGTYYIGVSAAGNGNYNANVAGSSTAGGSSGAFELTIDVSRQLNPVRVENRIQLVGAKIVTIPVGSPITVEGNLGTTGTPIFLTANQSANQVGDALRNVIAKAVTQGSPSGIGLRDDFLDVSGLNVADSGPFDLTSALAENDFSEYAPGTPQNQGALRAQNNLFEGVYLDDFIIGLTERGEMALNTVGNTAFIENPERARERDSLSNDSGAIQHIDIGPYQLEIRDGQEYGEPTLTRIVLVDSAEPNERFTSGQNVTFFGASNISDGVQFKVSDAINSLTFEFEDVDALNGVVPGNVAVPYSNALLDPITGITAAMTANQIASTVRDLINSPIVQSVLNVTAISINGDVTGETSDTLAFNGTATIELDSQIGVVTPVRGKGDGNRQRDQGQIIIENSRISSSSEFGIVLQAGVREALTNQAQPGAVRNTIVLNNERLVPGAVIVNNELFFNSTGGIRISGDSSNAGGIAAPVPFARIVNNTIVGGSITRSADVAAEVFGGQLFVGGAQSFADSMISYSPLAGGGPAPAIGLQTPTSALGTPNYTGDLTPLPGQGAVSLGRGGQMVLRFTDNFLTSSGDNRPDLYVFQAGILEDVNVEVSEDGMSFKPVGSVGLLTSTVDLDAFGISPNTRIFYVRLTDVASQGQTSGNSVGADIDAVGAITSFAAEAYFAAGLGIQISNNASPTLLNNVLVNNAVGLSVDASSASTVVGATLFQRNTANLGGNASLGQFPLMPSNTKSLFVDPANGVFYPSPVSPLIDASIDSLEDRLGLIAVKQPLGLQRSPIVAPNLDINGSLRVDDPTIDTPAGIGENVFKDRGAEDRSDFIGPAVVLVNPVDNDVQGSDSNPSEGAVQLLDAAIPYFDIKLIEGTGLASVSSGSGIDDSTVQKDSLVLYRNNLPLVEGLDYRFGYEPTSNTIRLTPLAGVWQTDSVYRIRFLNASQSTISLNNPAAYSDGASFTIVDDQGGQSTFELDLGYRIQVPSSGSVHSIQDATKFTIDDGVRRIVFEYDLGSGVGSGNTPIAINASDSADTVADKTVAVIRTTSLLVTPVGLGSGLLQLNGSAQIQFLPQDSGLISTGSTGVRPRYGLRIPTNAGKPAGVDDGQSFTISLANGNSAKFEIDTNGSVAPGSTAVAIGSNPTTDQIADAIVTAIQRAGLGLAPVNSGNGFIAVGGNSDVRINATATVLSVVGAPGLPAAISVPVSLELEPDAAALAVQLAAAINAQGIQGVSALAIGNKVLIEGGRGVVGTGSSAVGAISDLAGNRVRANLVSGETELTIFLGEGQDFGDAPDPNYDTLAASSGPRHTVVDGFSLGPTVSPDGDARLTNADSDDGVAFTNDIVAGFGTSLTVNVTGATAAQPAYISAWIDFDGDGAFEEGIERILTNRQVVTSGDIAVPISRVPGSSVTGETYARFRLSSSSSAVNSPLGNAPDGEVEDYAINIQGNPYRNPSNNLDVSADGFVSPIDVLQVINYLNLNGSGPLPYPPGALAPPPYLDVNGDGSVTPQDALIVVNFLNSRGSAGSEGEGFDGASWMSAVSSPSPTTVGVSAGPNAVFSASLLPSMTGAEEDKESFVETVDMPVSYAVHVQRGTTNSSSVLDDPVIQAMDDILDDLGYAVSQNRLASDPHDDLFGSLFFE